MLPAATDLSTFLPFSFRKATINIIATPIIITKKSCLSVPREYMFSLTRSPKLTFVNTLNTISKKSVT